MQGEDGNRFNATIIEIKDKSVTIDLNHPRAGMDLHFVGEVVENRLATNEEVAELLNAMSGCGGGCSGGCSGGCGGGCSDGGCGGGCGGC
jgi:FKBP-type peptidyl-prolyl cis-trans isomerase SlyD